MKFLEKSTFTPLAFAALLASGQVNAAPVSHTIQISAVVPTADFYVIPTDPSWIGNNQVLSFNQFSKQLDSLTKQFDVKHTAGAVDAKLLTPAILASSNSSIPLTVKFNSKTLDTTNQEVVSAEQAKSHSVVNLEIIPQKTVGADYIPGTYSGNVQLSFDAKI